jgi:hypothetical protein
MMTRKTIQNSTAIMLMITTSSNNSKKGTLTIIQPMKKENVLITVARKFSD